jgi:hypothetical protein
MSTQVNETDDAIARFLEQGGVIRMGSFNESGRVEGSSMNPWGSRKPGRPPANAAPIPTIEPEEE